ncbi:MAG: hypothetical protein A2Z96_07585 [Spirochaetes bacterium GWB1_48_6]|nr:MAG: hypothetical protein A2Z96_07585 [Spirochaetes bacterium GWB1_48_6]
MKHSFFPVAVLPFRKSILMFLAMLAFLAADVDAQSAFDIFEHSSIFLQSERVTMQWKMTIHDAQGEKNRELQVFTTRNKGIDRMLVRITVPASLSGLKILRISSVGDASQTWLKTSRGVRRLAGSSGGEEKLFGSDFTIADLSAWNGATHTLERLVEQEAPDTWVIRATGADDVVRILTIVRESSLVASAKYLGIDGSVVRSYLVEEWASTGSDIYPKRVRMTDNMRKTWTVVEVLALNRTTPIPESLFNPASL